MPGQAVIVIEGKGGLTNPSNGVDYVNLFIGTTEHDVRWPVTGGQSGSFDCDGDGDEESFAEVWGYSSTFGPLADEQTITVKTKAYLTPSGSALSNEATIVIPNCPG